MPYVKRTSTILLGFISIKMDLGHPPSSKEQDIFEIFVKDPFKNSLNKRSWMDSYAIMPQYCPYSLLCIYIFLFNIIYDIFWIS